MNDPTEPVSPSDAGEIPVFVDPRTDRFLAALGHELRNPLSPILSGAQLLQLIDDDWSLVYETSALVERQVGQILRVLDQLRDVSRISRGSLQIERGPVDLKTVIGQAVETSRPEIDQAGHSLRVTLPSGTFSTDGDAGRLAQVLSQLLENAARHTERGGEIELSLARERDEAVIRVRDSGMGIAAENLPFIFDVYHPSAPARDRTAGGLGLGLALSRALVRMHRGSVDAQSEGAGRGSVFTVRLPLHAEERAERTASHSFESSTLPAASGRRVLVVDDNRDAARTLSLTLKLAGCEVRTVFDGRAAVEEVGAFRPDVVVLDIGMPQLNGYDACRRIRELPDGERLLLIAVTGWGAHHDRTLAEEAGFDHHLTKPVKTEDLLRLVREGRPCSANE